tara:strand:+ start:580 stop:711 length:132 start_codon:yes stop_codon:yes gene_type:complete
MEIINSKINDAHEKVSILSKAYSEIHAIKNDRINVKKFLDCCQ